MQLNLCGKNAKRISLNWISSSHEWIGFSHFTVYIKSFGNNSFESPKKFYIPFTTFCESRMCRLREPILMLLRPLLANYGTAFQPAHSQKVIQGIWLKMTTHIFFEIPHDKFVKLDHLLIFLKKNSDWI